LTSVKKRIFSRIIEQSEQNKKKLKWAKVELVTNAKKGKV
jgi:hypothetical protein